MMVWMARLPFAARLIPIAALLMDNGYHRGILIENPGVPTPPNVYMHSLNIINGRAAYVDLSTCTVNLGYTVGGCGGGVFINGAGIIYINDFIFENNWGRQS